MGSLAFYPWLTLRQPAHVGGWQLIPWRRGQHTPGHWSPDEQGVIDHVLETFHQGLEAPISTATVAVRVDSPATADMEEGEADDLLDLSELVAFAGLAERRFFSDIGYVNTGNFKLVIERWKELGGGFVVRSRRRDGVTQNYTKREWHKEFRPPEVNLHDRPELNQQLIDGLVATRETTEWGRYSASLPLFNRANTDSEDMSQAMEAGLTASAFERFLDSPPKDHELARRFVAATPLPENLPRAGWNRVPKHRFIKATTLREAWIRDLWNVRGKVAHGKDVEQYPALWSVPEHLLLAAFTFPLMVKLDLVRLAHYELSSMDEIRLEAFEPLLAEHLHQQEGEDEWPWKRVISGAWYKPAGRKAMAYLREREEGARKPSR